MSQGANCPDCHGHGLLSDPGGGAPVACPCPVGQERERIEAAYRPRPVAPRHPPSEPLPAEAFAAPSPSYHDLHITTARIPRTSIFNLPLDLTVQCHRAAGWQLWRNATDPVAGTMVAGEFEGADKWLILDVRGTIIVNSRDRDPDSDD